MSLDFDIDHSLHSEPSERRVYSVSEITREIKQLIESAWPIVGIEGEISNFKRHSSGHFYFSLKDAEAHIGCVMWRGRNQGLLFSPEDGMKVQAFGRLTLYERQGRYQLDVYRMQPAGRGELQMAFEAMKRRLLDKGWFESVHKKPLPAFPTRIGIVTSETGAAIRDIVSVISRRFPPARLILRSVRVQGPGAAEEIAQAVRDFNAFGKIDVIIAGRGGGSLEDLWPFNEEVVAEAIFESDIPIISAVGHEVDFSISDFVADMRAPTPSAAAELVVRDRDELKTAMLHRMRGITQTIYRRLRHSRERIGYIGKSYAFRYPLDRLREYRQRLDEMSDQVQRFSDLQIEFRRMGLMRMSARLRALNPDSILGRGYSITRRLQDGRVIRSHADVAFKEDVVTQLADGQVFSTVNKVEQSA